MTIEVKPEAAEEEKPRVQVAVASARRDAVAPEGHVIEPAQKSVCELFQEQVRRRGPEPALHFKAAGRWNPITWQQYGAAVKRITGFLLAEGLEPGQRTAVLSYNRPEWHIADLATLHAGGTTVGVYLTNSAAQCQYILDHAEAQVAFVENEQQLQKLLEVKAGLPQLKRVVVFNSQDAKGHGDFVISWERALQVGEEHDQAHLGDFDRRWQAVEPSDMAAFIYTSGTTGPPKAVMLDHRNLLWTGACIKSYLQLAENPSEDVTLSYLPLAHIAERMAGEILHVQHGHKLYFAEDLAHLAANVAEVRPTFMFGVPRIWEKFQQAVQGRLAAAHGAQGLVGRWALSQGIKTVDARLAGGDGGAAFKLADRLALSKVRHLLGFDRVKLLSTGAAPISEETLRFFWGLGLPLYEVYGESENCGPATTCRPGLVKLGTVGPPIPGDEIKLADDGEILVRGGNIFRGYYKDEKTTAETLDPDGFLHTGDVGELDRDGFLRITDRKKDLIITAGGKNISPSNIEVALKHAIPYAGQAIAIGDRRPFMSALLTIDAEQVQKLAAEVGEPADIAALARSEKVRAIFQRGVDQVNAQLSNVEAIKKFVILPNDLSVDGGELTPTLKVKRKVVNEKYAEQLEALYSG